MRRTRPAPPPRRSRHLPWRRASFIALDLETTGLDLGHDRIVSFGAVPVTGGVVRLGEATHDLVDPGDRGPSRTSVTIHRIRPVDLVGAMSMHEAAGELAALLDRRYLLAWYARVETSFLGSLFAIADRSWKRRTIDVRDLLVALEGASTARMPLTAAAGACGVPVADPHHALDDALVTAQLFVVLASRLEARDGRATVGELLRLPRTA
ncbi:MAG: 3'-5' exonuclease [Actinomycetota bacterium]